MNIHPPLTRLLALLALLLPIFSQSLKAQNVPPPENLVEITDWTAEVGNKKLTEAVGGGFSAVNPSDDEVPWRVLMEGRDIYGNSVAVPLAAGILQPNLGITFTTNSTNKAPVAITFSDTIPNDGTLHNGGTNSSDSTNNLSGPSYAINLYVGTNVTALSPGNRVNGTPGLYISVTPDLAIPPVTQVTKIRATATATAADGEVTALTPRNPGQGYDPFTPPAVTFAGPGSGAAATAVVDPATGSILRFDITSKGTGYPDGTVMDIMVANPPTTQTQLAGGVLYGYNEMTGKFNYAYNSGDAVRFQTSVRNNTNGDGRLQSRPMRSTEADQFRLTTVLTVDPVYQAEQGYDDLRVFNQDCAGDMAGYPDELSEIRTVRTYHTPPAVPVYGVPVAPTTAAATAEIGGGRVTNINITRTNTVEYNPLNPPPVTIATNAGGSGATAVAQLDSDGFITNIVVVSPGAGYTSAPAVTIAPPAYGARYYQPMPDDGFLDIGEQIELGYDVLMPQRYPGIFFVAAKVDARNQIAEPIGFSPGRESPPLDPSALVNNNTFVSDVATRVQILSGPGPGIEPVSQVTDPSGAPLIQSDGDSDMASVNEDGGYVAFESYARDLAVSQSAATALQPTLTGLPPLYSELGTSITSFLESALANGNKQVFRRDTITKEIEIVSVSSAGAQASANAQNASINSNGRQIAFESRAPNLVPNDTGGSSDIFVRSMLLLRTVRVSVNASGVQGNAGSFTPSISGNINSSDDSDGRYVAFASLASNLDLSNPKPDDNIAQQIFVHDRDVSGSGKFDAEGNVRTYMVSVTTASEAADGWCDSPKISEDGKFLTFVSYSSNLPKVAGGPIIGDEGYQGVVYRVELDKGSPIVNTMQAVSVNTAGELADALSYEPAINGDGSQVAFTSLADNLVDDDTNAFADVFVRDFTNNKTVRVSESLNRFAIGTIRFSALPTQLATPPDNNPRDGDSFDLGYGTNKQTLTFRLIPTGDNEVLIGATASASRDNLVRAINALQASVPPRLNILAIADSPASPNTFYPPTSRVPGQAYYPGLFLLSGVKLDEVNGSEANLEIGGNFVTLSSTDGVNIGEFPSGNLVETTGMRIGGTQADDDAGEIDGVPGGSTMPSIDRTGMVVAFRSTMQTLDVFNRTYNGLNGLRRGDLIRMLRNASANVYIRDRDRDGSGAKAPDALDNVETKRVSVNKFGYSTDKLLNLPTSAQSHKPAVSARGRFIAFSSDAENTGGLAFGRTNLDPQDNNGYRDVYLYDRDVTTEPTEVIINNPPEIQMTEPSWLNGQKISVGAKITVNAVATDTEDKLDTSDVVFFFNGEQTTATNRYGDSFSAEITVKTVSESNVIQARATDKLLARNSTTTSAPITFASTSGIGTPTSVTMLPLSRGTILEVGQPVELNARVTFPLFNNVSVWRYLNYVRFYANGVLIGTDDVTGLSGTASITWFPSSAEPVVLSAIAIGELNYPFDPDSFSTLYSNKLLSTTVLGADETAAVGTPAQIVISTFQTVLSRPPTGTEYNYWLTKLSNRSVTPAGMVLQLVSQSEYMGLQNTLFGYYYLLNTAPDSVTYARNLNAMEAAVTPLPAGGQPPAANGAIASPYGATGGDATAAQYIISSAAFATANPGVQTMADNSYLTWYYNRWGGQIGFPSGLSTAMTAYTPLAENKGYATALISALYYTGRDQTAFNYQLKATSLRWLYTDVWSAPTSPAVKTQAQLKAFVEGLVSAKGLVSTHHWIVSNKLTGDNAKASAIPKGDGISNLRKFAFNMDPKRKYTKVDQTLTKTGASGLPLVQTIVVGGKRYLQVTYMRRINENSLRYTPQFSPSLTGGWKNTTSKAVVTPVNARWEKVTVRDSQPMPARPATRFARVAVSALYWLPPTQQ